MSKEIKKKESAPLAEKQDVDDIFGNEPPKAPIDSAPPQINILREAQMFEMPNGQKIEEFEARILHWHNANQYYATKFEDRKPEDSLFPNCLSSDGIRPDQIDEQGYEMQAETCAECSNNEYGSDADGAGKACQNTIRMALLLEGEVVPVLIKATPASLSKKGSLKRWLVNAPNESNKAGCGSAYQAMKVRFTLEKKEFQSGLSASALVLETVDVLKNPDDIETLVEVARITRQFRESYIGHVAEHMAAETGSDEDVPDFMPEDTI